MENATTDGGFLKLVIEKLRPNLTPRFAGVRSTVEIRQAGGISEVAKEVVRISMERQAARPGTKGSVRVLALCDSDARAPQRNSQPAAYVAAEASRVGADAWILRKRSIENYIPHLTLQALAQVGFAGIAPALKLLMSLTREQQDHYPLKKGLAQSDLEQSATSLFNADLELGLGFGDFMTTVLTDLRHLVNSDDLIARDGVGELQALLELIERLS